LVRNIEHGLELEKMIEGSLFVHGSKDSDFRKDVIDRMESGDLQYVIASNIFNEGISINAIRVLIVASGGKSKIETVQRLGRALRKDEGKEEAIVYDFYDYGNKYTSRHSEERMRTYKKVGFPVNLLES
jgi:superfamily II DNA or RNA helicase